MNASFSSVPARDGGNRLFTQSGAVAAALMDWAYSPCGRLPLCHFIGRHDRCRFRRHAGLRRDGPGTKAVLLYVESVTSARKFMSAARPRRDKPVIVVKSGRHPAAPPPRDPDTRRTGGIATPSMTPPSAGAGLLRVRGLGDLFSAAETLSRAPTAQDAANGGDPDQRRRIRRAGHRRVARCRWHHGGAVRGDTGRRLEAAMPRTWSHGANPIDIVGDADVPVTKPRCRILLTDPGIDRSWC